MRSFKAIIILGLAASLFSGALAAQEEGPFARKLSTKNVIFLQGQDRFAPLELIEYKTKVGPQKFYIRTEETGRYLKKQDRIVDTAYFNRVRSSSPLRASVESLLFFHESAEYKWRGPNRANANQKNWNSRFIKIGLLAAVAGTFTLANQKSKALDGSFRYFNHSSPETAYNRARNQYLLTALLTAGYFLYTTVKAYRNFGRDQAGQDLMIPARKLGNVAEILKTEEFEPVLPNSNLSNLQSFISTPTIGPAPELSFAWQSNL